MTNNVRVKLMKMEMLSELVDKVICATKDARTELENLMAKPADEICSWEKYDIEQLPMKIQAYEDLIKALEKLA